MPFTPETEVIIEKIVSVNYFEYPRDFAFSGEMHNFWEVIYSDKDYISVTVRSKEEILPPGHFKIICPMELHSVKPAYGKAANAVIFSFVCDNEKLMKSSGKILECDFEKKEHIKKLISAAQDAFSTPLNEPNSTRLVRNKHALPGSENLVKIYMELFVLSCIRENINVPASASPLLYTSDPMLSEICTYLENNVTKNIDFTHICTRFNMSKTTMKKICRENLNIGAMDYFNKCKIDCAKHLIREKEMNLAEISAYLCFSSQQYFSRRFREITGMTPSQYLNSVK